MRRDVTPPEAFPHSMEPQLRKLGLSSKLERGVPTLSAEHVVCKQGDVLSSEQVRYASLRCHEHEYIDGVQSQLLKLLGEKLSTFRITLLARWDSESSSMTQIAEPSVELTGSNTKEVEMADADADDEDEDEDD